MARGVMERLRTSERLRAHVAALARHHLRAGYLVHRRRWTPRGLPLPADDGAGVRRRDAAVDRRPAGHAGRKAEEAIPRHLEVARELLDSRARARPRWRPPPLVRGDELAGGSGDRAGAGLGRLLGLIAEARYAGEVATAGGGVGAGARRAGGSGGPMPAAMSCLFCKIVSGELPATKVAEDDRTIAFMDINPATRGHLLVIPKAHAEVFAADDDDVAAVHQAAKRWRGGSGAPGGRRGEHNSVQRRAAWQTVFHLHVHVIPRYEDDPLRLPWVPQPGTPRDRRCSGRIRRN